MQAEPCSAEDGLPGRGVMVQLVRDRAGMQRDDADRAEHEAAHEAPEEARFDHRTHNCSRLAANIGRSNELMCTAIKIKGSAAKRTASCVDRRKAYAAIRVNRRWIARSSQRSASALNPLACLSQRAFRSRVADPHRGR